MIAVTACSSEPNQFSPSAPLEVTLSVDGQRFEVSTDASNVRELLSEEGITISDADLVDPPLFTPLEDGIEIDIVRVSESIEFIEQTVPFQRRSVRNESMSSEAPPIIVQSGRSGLQELTVRIVYHDGLEFSRQQTQVIVLEPAQDEIVMIGVGLAQGAVDFPGQLAFINGGNSIILRGSSAVFEQLDTGGDLDRRVFTLSPTGSHLLYTKVSSDTAEFNTLWSIETSPDAEPVQLGVENVLWADWNPAPAQEMQIAYTTGIPTELLPGWEANNDLWVGEVPLSNSEDFDSNQLIEAYPATYGWWGGNYIWSPFGRYIAYSHADEVGVIDTEALERREQRVRLHTFSEFNTGADWVWIPSLAWSPDGNFIAFNRHADDSNDSANFDTWVINVSNSVARQFVSGSGIWGHPHWSPAIEGARDEDISDSQIAFLRASDPLESQRSSYTLWVMDRDGSNTHQLYPPAGENSRFPREQSSFTWGPNANFFAFVYDDDLYIFDMVASEARQISQDDNQISNPTWAPYGPSARKLLIIERPRPTDEASFPIRGFGLSE